MSIFSRAKDIVVESTPVLVIDSLGLTSQIRRCSTKDLASLSAKLDRNFHRLETSLPFKFVVHTKNRVFGTDEFSAFRLNDMFITYSMRSMPDFGLRYLIVASLVFQALLIDGFIPRGGLGFGSIVAGKQSILGLGFIDAYEASEKREELTRNICAIQVSSSFLNLVKASEKAARLLYFFGGSFYVNPTALHDPDLGVFDRTRFLELLKAAGTNEEKMKATERFVLEGEDYESALRRGSRSRLWADGFDQVG